MYSLPSTSQSREPAARRTKKGSPPTARKARTGELTPPGVTAAARRKRARVFARRSTLGIVAGVLLSPTAFELVILPSDGDPDEEAPQRPAARGLPGRRH